MKTMNQITYGGSTTCSAAYCLKQVILHDWKNIEVHSVTFIMTPD